MNKILIITNHILGLYSFRKELIHELLDEGYEVIILTPKHEKVKYFTNLGCECIEVSLNRRGKNPFGDAKLFWEYFNVIRKLKPKVALTYTVKPNIYGGLVCRILKTPYIANITGLGSGAGKKGFMQKIILTLYKLSLKNVEVLFFQNEQNREVFSRKNILNSKHELIPGSGVNLDHFYPMNYPNDEVVKFLFIARIMKEKGIEQYLQAAEIIKKSFPNTEFHVLGECEVKYKNKINEMHKKGVIIYHGRQEKIREFQKISHCTIHPSYYPEGMSNVLLESAACARPIITTNKAGCREIVDHNITGYIVEQKNVNDLVEKINLFLSKTLIQKKQMGEKGREKIEKEFSREIITKRYLDIIKSI